MKKQAEVLSRPFLIYDCISGAGKTSRAILNNAIKALFVNLGDPKRRKSRRAHHLARVARLISSADDTFSVTRVCCSESSYLLKDGVGGDYETLLYTLHTMSATRWTMALREAGVKESILKKWDALRVAVVQHQRILAENGIGKEVSERDRVRVNARRVGLEAPPFADEAAATFADVLGIAMNRRSEQLDSKQRQS